MTIVYDPLTYRTVVARPGEIPYKFWSVNKHVIDAASAGICTLHSGDDAPADTTKLWLDLTMPENAVGAVKAHNGSDWVALTPALFYSHIAGGAGGFVTNLEMETYVSGLLGVTIQAWSENLDQWSAIDPTAKEDEGVAATLITAHEAAANPHPTYLTAAEGDAAYQPLDSDLTAIAALSTTAYGRALLALADAAALRTTAGLVIGTNVQAYDADLTTWAGLTPSANAQSLVTAADYAAMRTLLGLVIGTNVQAYDADLTTWAGLTPSANAQSLVTAANYAAMRGLLDLEAGTDFLSPAAIAAAYQPLDGDLTSWAGVTRAAGLDTFAATPSSANLRSLLTDETGTGAAVFGTAPTVSSPVITGTPDIQQALVISGDVSPSQITSDQNDYAPTGLSTATVLRLNSDAARNITGLTGGADGRVLIIHNVGAFAIVLKDENASSTAANRFALNADVSLGADASTFLQYDATTSRWRVIGGAGGGGGGSGDALVANPLSQFAATTSAQLAGVMSDETGSGALVFATSPTLVSPALGTPASGDLSNCTKVAKANPNILINGDGMIDQRAASTAADDVYHADRWYALTQTGAITPSIQTLVTSGVPYLIRILQAQASAQRIGSAQIVESADSTIYRGQTLTLSGKVRMSTSATVRFAILEWTGTADAVTSDVVNDWTSSTYTTGNFFKTTSMTVAGVGSLALTANTVTDISLSAAISTSCTNLIVMIWSEATMAQNATLDYRLKLENAATATDWISRPRFIEDIFCKRYFHAIRGNAGARFAQGMNTSTSACNMVIPGVYLRDTPSATFSNLTVVQAGTITDVASVATTFNYYSATLSCTVSGTPLTSGSLCQARFGPSTGYVFLDIEL